MIWLICLTHLSIHMYAASPLSVCACVLFSYSTVFPFCSCHVHVFSIWMLHLVHVHVYTFTLEFWCSIHACDFLGHLVFHGIGSCICVYIRVVAYMVGCTWLSHFLWSARLANLYYIDVTVKCILVHWNLFLWLKYVQICIIS